MSDALSSIRSGLAAATQQAYVAAQRVAGGDIAQGAVDLAGAKTQLTAETKMLKLSLERDRQLLDILA